MSVEQLETRIESVESYSVFADGGHATIEPLDKIALTALADAQEEGEPDLIVELIDLYLDDAPKLVGDIQRGAKGGDAIAIKRAALRERASIAATPWRTGSTGRPNAGPA